MMVIIIIVVAIVIVIPATIPLLGWANWFALPLIVIGIVLERYIIKGMASGAVK